MVTAREAAGLEQLLGAELGVKPAALARARRHANERGLMLMEAVVDLGLASETALAEAVAHAAGALVVDLDEDAVDVDAARALDPVRARSLLALPFAEEGGERGLRVAFADPLDATAVAAVAEATGRPVVVAVATLSAVRAAIERVAGLGRRPGRADGAAHAELGPEATRMLQDGERADLVATAFRTTPMARIEESASVSQRLDALVQALEEVGVLGREDYVRALKRILGT